LKSFFSIHTELENGDSGEPKAIRFILETSIFDVILAYKLKHTDTKYLSGEWMPLPIDLPIKGQMEFELLGKDAHLFMLKESFREEKGEIKLRLLWN
jgi:hypothetical protein